MTSVAALRLVDQPGPADRFEQSGPGGRIERVQRLVNCRFRHPRLSDIDTVEAQRGRPGGPITLGRDRLDHRADRGERDLHVDLGSGQSAAQGRDTRCRFSRVRRKVDAAQHIRILPARVHPIRRGELGRMRTGRPLPLT